MTSVSAAEFQRQFGRIRTLAHREPVMVTNHGRADLVVLSAQEYQRLKRRDRQAILASEMSDADLALLDAMRIPDELKAFDHEVD